MRRLARLLVLAAALPLLAAAVDPSDQRRDLARIETWFNDLKSMRARFVQFAPDGGQASGDLLFQRPDKMRLDYHPPSPILIIANGWELVYVDRQLQQTSHILTSSTPLGFLLEDEIRFSGDVTVDDFAKADGQIRVTVSQTDAPAEGSITLFFEDEPLALRRWAVTDAQGLTTHVVLEDVEFDVAIDGSLFRYRKARRRFGVGRDD